MSDEIFLFLDTETTGFKKSGPKIQAGQARVVQLAMILTDANNRSLFEIATLVKPDGWKISEGAGKVHGKSDELCSHFGIEFRSMFALYHRIASMATMLVAHQSEFDSGLMAIEGEYYNVGAQRPLTVTKPWHCTLLQATPICNLPPTDKMKAAGFTKPKAPKVSEALKIICGEELVNAHDAMFDVQACRKIFFAMKNK